jgi:hypothetical protein
MPEKSLYCEGWAQMDNPARSAHRKRILPTLKAQLQRLSEISKAADNLAAAIRDADLPNLSWGGHTEDADRLASRLAKDARDLRYQIEECEDVLSGEITEDDAQRQRYRSATNVFPGG